MAAGEGEQRLWYYITGLGAEAQTHGPFDVPTMQGLFKDSYLTEDALVWAEGNEEWLPLKACHDLYGHLAFEEDKKEVVRDPQLEAFEAQIAAVEADQPLETDSPPPDERHFVDDDGTEFIWDPQLRKFRPQDLPAQPANDTAAAPAAVAPEYDASVMQFPGDEDEPQITLEQARAEEEASAALADALPEEQRGNGKRASGDFVRGPDPSEPLLQAAKTSTAADTSAADAVTAPAGSSGADATGDPAESGQQWFELKNNTSVYVTGLPDDTTVEEVAAEFAKCGVVKQNDDGTPKVKLYKDKETGLLKGDGTVTFLLRPSVRLATTIMHGVPLRPGGAPKLAVEEAKFEMKRDRAPAAAAAMQGGQSDAKAKGGQKGGKGGQKGKGTKNKVQAQKEKLLSWTGFDDKHKDSEVTVLAAGLFTDDEMLLSPDLHDQVQAYLVARCRDLGAVDKVRVFKRTCGVATVRLRVPDAATAAVARLAATVMVAGMFTQPALAADKELPKVIIEDVAMKCQQVGVKLAAETDEARQPKCPVHVLTGSSAGRVAVACASEEDAARCAHGFHGQGYAGVALHAAVVQAQMWDGVTNPATFGQAADMRADQDDETRLQAFSEEMAGT